VITDGDAEVAGESGEPVVVALRRRGPSTSRIVVKSKSMTARSVDWIQAQLTELPAVSLLVRQR
jgi:hypothetical protein